MRVIFRYVLIFVSGLLMPPGLAADIALIIDDMGNSRQEAIAFQLPSQVAFSILPHTFLSQQYAERAARQHREVMLHIPMESLNGKALGPGGITSDMHPAVIQARLGQALSTVPNAIGLNNHMGSKLTQLTLPMRTTMAFLQRQDLFFVDSRTTRFSKAERIAKEQGVPVAKRNVFLDHLAEPKHIKMQFERLLRAAKKYGQAIGIGHPYPQTLDFLQQTLPDLSNQGVRLVPLSDIVHTRYLVKAQVQQTLSAQE